MRAKILAGFVLMVAYTFGQTGNEQVEAPRFWNDRELADWALPVAGLNVRPAHFSERDYYAAPDAEWVRTYGVYFPGREPAGYWDTLRQRKPEPLITPGPRTVAQWIADGRRVFEEMDVPLFRSTDPRLIAIARSAGEFSKRGGHPQKDGTVFGLRWVPTSQGIAVSISDCSGCHTRILPDGTTIHGAPFNAPGDGLAGELIARGVLSFFSGDTLAMAGWRQFATPGVAALHPGLLSYQPFGLVSCTLKGCAHPEGVRGK